MLYRVYSCYDKVAQEFAPPYLGRNHAVAIRGFKNMMASERVPTPSDFRLYWVGSFDGEKGVLTPVSPIEEVFSPGSDEDVESASLSGAGG